MITWEPTTDPLTGGDSLGLVSSRVSSASTRPLLDTELHA